MRRSLSAGRAARLTNRPNSWADPRRSGAHNRFALGARLLRVLGAFAGAGARASRGAMRSHGSPRRPRPRLRPRRPGRPRRLPREGQGSRARSLDARSPGRRSSRPFSHPALALRPPSHRSPRPRPRPRPRPGAARARAREGERPATGEPPEHEEGARGTTPRRTSARSLAGPAARSRTRIDPGAPRAPESDAARALAPAGAAGVRTLGGGGGRTTRRGDRHHPHHHPPVRRRHCPRIRRAPPRAVPSAVSPTFTAP